MFFGIGTALFAFYHVHPDRLDPTITTDQLFPMFIATEMPIGIAGLIVAGIFSAAQSTVSTSMNSTATTIVTDFLRPLNVCRSERGYLNSARAVTLLMGVLGTLLGLVFVNPEIKSLFDAFIKVIGLFMGVPRTEAMATEQRIDLDRIMIFKKNLEKICQDEEDLIDQIQITVRHEVGHYLGLDEDDLERLGLA